MASIKDYRDLDTWQESMRLAELCYSTSGSFPKSEVFGLTQQMRRAAVSIPSNVAEGHRRRTRQAFVNHLSIALGSEAEVETCALLAHKVGFMGASDLAKLETQATTVRRLLFALVRSLG